jgi:hypothetical protein
MSDPRTDAIAAEAARLLDAGRAADIDEAIRIAADLLGHEHAPLPGPGRVRNHARALAMQALGEDGYRASVRNVWEIAERLMTVLAEAMPDADQLLVGRAAEGLIDAGVTVHVRLYTEAPIGEVARLLVEFGYDEPAFETAETRLGRLSRLRLIDEGIEIVVTRLLPHMARWGNLDVFTGRPVKTATLEELRRRLEVRE